MCVCVYSLKPIRNRKVQCTRRKKRLDSAAAAVERKPISCACASAAAAAAVDQGGL